MWIAKCLAVGGIALVLYSYIVYPLLIRSLAAIPRKASPPPAASSQGLPRVAVVIAAYNEEKHIAARIENLLALTYPQHLLQIHIGDDGSKDATVAIARRYSSDRVTIHFFERNRGKAAVLNDVVAKVEAPIIVFSDANTEFEKNAVEPLVALFSSANVGAVCGELNLLAAKGTNVDSIYWQLERSLKRAEARLGGLLGANGAIYAIRRELWRPLAADTICDDFVVVMGVAAQGRRVAYAEAAVAHEETPENVRDEYWRRVRIGIGNFQVLFGHPEFLMRTSFATRFTYVSHKVLRWITPHLVIVALVAALVATLSDPAWWIPTLILAGGIMAGLVLYRIQQRIGAIRMPRLLRLLALLFAVNAAFLVASWRYFRGQYAGSWQRTGR